MENNNNPPESKSDIEEDVISDIYTNSSPTNSITSNRTYAAKGINELKEESIRNELYILRNNNSNLTNELIRTRKELGCY